MGRCQARPATGVILAGGLGTRLRPVLGNLPKALAPVEGRPFLAYQLDWLKRQGVTRVILCTGYGHDSIQATFGDGAALGMQILYSIEQTPLGTAGALRQARHYLQETFLVMNGDTYFATDLSALLASHRESGAPATLALVHVPQAGRFGAVTVDARGYVTHFAEKKRHRAGLINAGIYVFEPVIWAHFPDRVPLSRKASPQSSERRVAWDTDNVAPSVAPNVAPSVAPNVAPSVAPAERLSLENDVFPALAAQRLLRGQVLEGYHIDIGTPESYAQFQQDVCSGDFSRSRQ